MDGSAALEDDLLLSTPEKVVIIGCNVIIIIIIILGGVGELVLVDDRRAITDRTVAERRRKHFPHSSGVYLLFMEHLGILLPRVLTVIASLHISFLSFFPLHNT